MVLKEFVENFAPDETIRVIQNDEILYEGKVAPLAKLLKYNVLEKSGKIVDGITQIEVKAY